jgi:hypothetical protein
MPKKKLGALHSLPGRRQCDRGYRYLIAEISAARNGQLGGEGAKGLLLVRLLGRLSVRIHHLVVGEVLKERQVITRYSTGIINY